jgi:hypothetical protein
MNDIFNQQQARLRGIIEWATKAREKLSHLLQEKPVHFRPASTGVSMIGLLPDKPQRGENGFRDLDRLVKGFPDLFEIHCVNIKQGRPTEEKALQSFLIREAYQDGRKLQSLNVASQQTNTPVELVFIADEISLPIKGGKIVCDLLALRRDGNRSTPVLLELKSERQMSRLVEQVNGFSTIIEEHLALFGELFSAILGEPVMLEGKVEKWLIWPSSGQKKDPREEELSLFGIRLVSYTKRNTDFSFLVGETPGS